MTWVIPIALQGCVTNELAKRRGTGVLPLPIYNCQLFGMKVARQGKFLGILLIFLDRVDLLILSSSAMAVCGQPSKRYQQMLRSGSGSGSIISCCHLPLAVRSSNVVRESHRVCRSG